MRAKYNLQPWVTDELIHILNCKNGIANIDRFIVDAHEIVTGGKVNDEMVAKAACVRPRLQAGP